MKDGGNLLFVFYALGLTVWIGILVIVFRVLHEMRAAAAVERALSDIGFNPREVYNESLKVLESHSGAWRTAVSGGKPGKTEGDMSQEPLAALFFFVNQAGSEGLSDLKPDFFVRQRLEPVSVLQLRAIQLFVASAELPEAEYQEVRRQMSRRQRNSADKIRSSWHGRISARMKGVAQTKVALEEQSRQADLWRQERANPALGQNLTDWLCAQSPDVWHELCISIDWPGSAAAELVPFVEWLIARPDVDRGSVLVLLAQAVGDAIDTESYEVHDCARNRVWMKAAHDGLRNGFYAPMQLAIPPLGRQFAEILFEPERACAWALPQMDLDQTPTRPHHSEYVFIDNRPVESLETWKAKRSP
ncbi:hypothetical protein [Maliponia aquimaris]|uniref:DUF4274 domain-containing protein n=1 Tax=Maliponia aquimaris TaxID=1673631 RepID=A0A238K1G0_9RHOB|nr:hypothetical protein [Maliponia aquimaris]SMX36194.1 hypothetical protein MAA8898_00783 [Maliponia aquimaris]